MFHEIYSICVDCILDFQEMTVFGTPKQHKKSAAEGGRLLRLFFRLFCTVISWKSKIKSTHIEYISWNTFFSGSNYVLKYRFRVNFAKFAIFNHPTLGNSLNDVLRFLARADILENVLPQPTIAARSCLAQQCQ